MNFKLGELFCGPGGIGLGVHQAEYAGCTTESVWATDIDINACNTYEHNIGKVSPGLKVYNEDVRKLDFSELPEIDCLTFGFPCNDFSQVGEHKGIHGEYGPLYKNAIRAIKQYKPKWFLAENVSGLKSANSGEAFKLILKELHDEGYNVTPHLYKFEQYGVPQSRHRYIIIGIRSDLEQVFKVPAPFSLSEYKTCKEAIDHPPIPEWATNNTLTRQSETVVERLKWIKPGENAFTADLPDHLKLKVKGATISEIYKRLDPKRPSYTVTGSGGGGTHVYHWSENRALTNRERARLQTFPDDYEFLGSKESVRKQIGMAVPPEGIKLIIEAIYKTLNGIEYLNIPSSVEPLIYTKKSGYYAVPESDSLEQLKLLEDEKRF